MNIFRNIKRQPSQWWERDFSANPTDYAWAIVAVMLVLFGIFGPIARGAL